jgi:hypothetical protein
MLTILYIFESFIFIYISWLAGHFLFSVLKINFSTTIKTLVLPTIIGYGILANLGLFMSLVGIYDITFILLTVAGIIFISRKTIAEHIHSIKNLSKKNIRQYFSLFFREYKLLKLIIIVWIIFYFIIALFPWTWSPDGLAYHIPYVMDSVEKGSIEFPIKNNNYFGHFPFLIELLYGITIIIFNNFIVLKIIQIITLLSLIFIIIDFSKKYVKNKIFIYLLNILLLAHMTVIRIGVFGGMIDAFTHLYGISSFLLIVEYLLIDKKDKIEKKYLITAGLLLGLSLATKYLALFYALIIFVTLLGYYIYNKYKFKKIFLNLSVFLLSVFSMCGFWYLKNLLTTGSPFSPFFTGNPENEFAIEDLKIEKTFFNYFIFPFAYWGIDKIFKTQFALYNALYFAGMYLGAIYLFITKKFTALYGYLLIFLQVFLLLLFSWAHRPRFAIGVFSIALLLFVLQFDKIFQIIKNKINIRTKKYSSF